MRRSLCLKRGENDVLRKTLLEKRCEKRCKKEVVRKTLWERCCEKDVVRKMLWETRFEKYVVRKTLRERRCEKDNPSMDFCWCSYFIFYVFFQFLTVVEVAEDLISFTDLLVCFVLERDGGSFSCRLSIKFHYIYMLSFGVDELNP